MDRAGRVRVAFMVLALGAFALSIPSAFAGNDDEGETLLAYARRVASNQTFAGTVEVRWYDDEGREHVERVGARSVDGSFVVGVGDRQVVGRGSRRSPSVAGIQGNGWRAAAVQPAPRPGAAWQLEVAGRRGVAGRTATIVFARDHEGRVRARFAIDRQTGQLLRREVLDLNGHVVRSVGFVKLVTGTVTPAVPNVPGDQRDAPVPIATVPDGFVGPEVVTGSYRLLGRYRHRGGVLQLYYSDGLFTLSIFEQEGRVDWQGLPGGRSGRISGVRTRSYSSAVGTIAVWAHHNLAVTAVGDGPPDTVRAVVAGFSGAPDESSWVDDVTDFVLDPFRWE